MEFRNFFEHVKSLGFEDRPDYDYLKRLFRELFFRKGYTYDNIYDWDLLPVNNNGVPMPPDPNNHDMNGVPMDMNIPAQPGHHQAQAIRGQVIPSQNIFGDTNELLLQQMQRGLPVEHPMEGGGDMPGVSGKQTHGSMMENLGSTGGSPMMTLGRGPVQRNSPALEDIRPG